MQIIKYNPHKCVYDGYNSVESKGIVNTQTQCVLNVART